MPLWKMLSLFDSQKEYDEDDGADADMNNLDTIISYTNKKDVKEFGGTWDEMGIVIRNKARLVAQEYTQEERIDYDEVFAHVAGIEAIRPIFTYASV
ncbi:retrovirus-related pol polyprotein from transposon TNT 1-94 [Tanacetum coccineum]|uniref:Retrovirus-related pol polyprotein from transposon TNT 1-94 n=1 Tax=Tanacetum coccineum TaxID=301880 RepID=A0ABQ5BTQ6_9ASTR